ncbi:zinc finger protein 605-like [Esox lucius]|uniref:zinc finger protein 605-like n=1 Tax=Esox lucius TaxID=8010 RepID=UPI000661DCB8|nr:zinc finger protein 605-like [Esox lucius]XP_012994797.1 zinc finger protein 605-like [Esox lucius]XP_012994798.1 zinc finger protein 605-like [Esox lucius]XP_012994799.1 zinc finger protein 605-like [Esox lucius]
MPKRYINWELGDGGPPFCFSCEMIFPDHVSFHDHSCPVAGYICSCGTEFSKYVDMVDHSGLHEPGHTVMNYSTIKKQQYQREREHKEQLARLELTTGQGSGAVPGSSLMLLDPMTQANKPPCGAGAATKDLWHQFQPVVLIETLRKFGRTKPYRCAYCELGFATKDFLIWHHNTHIRNKVHGCLQCGVLLLSNNKSPRPNHHQCSSQQAPPETRFTTATVLSNRKQPAGYGKKVVQNQPCPDLFSSELQLGMHMVSQQPGWDNAVTGSSGRKDLICRVCQQTFQTVKLLERHRCTKAASFFAQKLCLTSSKQLNGHRKWEGTNPYSLSQRNGDKELAFNIQTSRKVTVYHKSVGPHRGTGSPAVSAKTAHDSDDDCFVIESSSTKPSQQVYQELTSSLPVLQT